MRLSLLSPLVLMLVSLLLAARVQAQQTTRPTGTKKAANGYHRTSSTKPRARSGAYSRYDRSGRRREEDMKLAPGLRLNMPSPPTTDYMGRPIKKKVAKPASTSSTISSEKAAPAAPVRKRR